MLVNAVFDKEPSSAKKCLLHAFETVFVMLKNPGPMGELSKSGASRGESLIFGYLIRRKRGVRSRK